MNKKFIYGFLSAILLVAILVSTGIYFLEKNKEQRVAAYLKESSTELSFDVLKYENQTLGIFEPFTHRSKEKKDLIFINFWATWCAPCVGEFPYFEELIKDSIIQSNYQFIFSSSEKEDKIQDFIKNKSLHLPFYKHKGSELDTLLFDHKSIPSNYIIDVKNKLIYKTSGAENWNSALNKQFLKSLI